MAIAPFTLQGAALRPRDIAKRLRVERTTVYRWIKSGELPAIEVGGTKYVLITAYERFVERRKKRATLEEQAERHIGAGVEMEGEVDRLAGLTVGRAQRAPTPVEPPLEDVRRQLKDRLDAYEARFGVASEHVHRQYLVERHRRVPGVPDDVLPAWASCYAAYADLSLVHAR